MIDSESAVPYITEDQRERLRKGSAPQNSGELNYGITRLVDTFIVDHGLSYATINEVIGVLECTKQELYRRIAVPYEDKKMSENGDVYNAS